VSASRHGGEDSLTVTLAAITKPYGDARGDQATVVSM
jgi:hypothetical protein